MPRSRPAISRINLFSKYLKDNPTSTARIDGYADHTGHGPANAALAKKRADAVKNYLVTAGVDSSRIVAAGYGEVSKKPATTRKPANNSIVRRLERLCSRRSPRKNGNNPIPLHMSMKSYSAAWSRTLLAVMALGFWSGRMPVLADPTDTSQPPVSDISDQTPPDSSAAPAADQAPTMPPYSSRLWRLLLRSTRIRF